MYVLKSNPTINNSEQLLSLFLKMIFFLRVILGYYWIIFYHKQIVYVGIYYIKIIIIGDGPVPLFTDIWHWYMLLIKTNNQYILKTT